jgi:hypothetical protein
MILNDSDIEEIADCCTPNTETGSLNYRKFARAIEAAMLKKLMEQKPVAEVFKDKRKIGVSTHWRVFAKDGMKLYTHPSADAQDAARYRWLRENTMKYSYADSLVGLLMRDVTELDAAMKGQL